MNSGSLVLSSFGKVVPSAIRRSSDSLQMM